MKITKEEVSAIIGTEVTQEQANTIAIEIEKYRNLFATHKLKLMMFTDKCEAHRKSNAEGNCVGCKHNACCTATNLLSHLHDLPKLVDAGALNPLQSLVISMQISTIEAMVFKMLKEIKRR